MTESPEVERIYKLVEEIKNLNLKLSETKLKKDSPSTEEDMTAVLEVYRLIKRMDETKKNTELPTDRKILPETKGKFIQLCKSLSRDFNGVIRLYGKFNDKVYTAGLLLEKGSIIGASLENVKTGKIVFKDAVITLLTKNLSGTKGDLEVYAFTDSDMTKAKTENNMTLLATPVPFNKLGMTIKSRMMRWVKKQKSHGEQHKNIKFTKPETMKLNEGEDFNLADFARKLPKIRILDQKIPDIENQPIRKFMFGDVNKTPDGKLGHHKILGTQKIETPIDRLYTLVQKQNRVKLNRELSNKLEVHPHKLENWAKILEKKELVTIYYPPFGEAEIRAIPG